MDFSRAAPIGSKRAPPGYPSAWLHACRARLRFTRSGCPAPQSGNIAI